MLSGVIDRIRGRAAEAEGDGDELGQALDRLGQRRSAIAARINGAGQDDMPSRRELERVAIDEATLVKARNTRGRFLPEAAKVIARVLGRAPVDAEHDPELRRLQREIAAIGGEGTAEADRLRRLILAGMGHGAAAAAAQEQIPAVTARIAALGERQSAARQALGERQAELGVARKAEQASARAAAPMRLAELRRRIVQRASGLDEHWQGIAREMAEDDADRGEVTTLLGLGNGGVFSRAAFRSRSRGAAARALAIDSGRPMENDNSLLGVKSPFAGEKAHWTLSQHTADAMRTELLFFETRQEAEDAAEQLAASGAEMIVVPVGGAFTLVGRERAFVERAEAAETLQTLTRTQGSPAYAIVDLPVGCAILPARLVE